MTPTPDVRLAMVPTAVRVWCVLTLFALGGCLRRHPSAESPVPNGFHAAHGRFEGVAPTHAARVEPDGVLVVTSRGPEDGITFSTVSIGREGAGGTGRSRPSLSRDGIVTILRGTVEEEIRNTRDGTELAWRFRARPAGEGAVSVRIGLRGATVARVDASGAHLDGARADYRFGHGTWIDASGRRTPIPVRADHGELTLTVPPEVVDGASYPAVLDPIISSEFGTDRPAAGVMPLFNERSPVLAAGPAGQFLLVWQDHRDETHPDILAVRLGADGSQLDLAGIRVGAAAGTRYHPWVAWNGTHYLVVWQDRVDGARIVGRRVAPDGRPVDATDIVISSGVDPRGAPVVVWNGTEFRVAWTGVQGTAQAIYSSRVSSAGAVLDASPVLLTTTSDTIDNLRLAVNGAQVAAIWTELATRFTGVVRSARIAQSGIVQGSPTVLTTAGVSDTIALAPLGDGFLAVWSVAGSGGLLDVVGARLNSAHELLDRTPILIGVGTGYDQSPTAVAEPSGVRVTWIYLGNRSERFEVKSARVSATGAVSAIATLPSFQSNGSGPTCALGSAGVLCGWEQLVEYTFRWAGGGYGTAGLFVGVYGARVDSTGASIDAEARILAGVANVQSHPDIAWNGTNYLAVWEDFRGSRWQIRGARFGSDGTVRDPEGIDISDAAAFNDRLPAVTALGSTFLVAFNREQIAAPSEPRRETMVTRVGDDGLVLDRSGVPVTEPTDPSVSFDTVGLAASGTGYQVARTARDYLFARRLDATARPVGGIVQLVYRPDNAQSPRAASNGSGFLVTWTAAFGFGSSIRGARIDGSGALLDPRYLELAPEISGGGTAVGFGTSDYVVTFASRQGLHSVRVPPTGTPGPATLIMATSGDFADAPGSTALTWAHGQFFSTFQRTVAGAPGSRLYGFAISPAGAAVDSAPFPLLPDATEGAPVGLASPRAGRVAVIYSRLDKLAPFGNYRARMRFVDDSPAMACRSSAECAGRPCVDGMCCNTACGGGDPTDCQACSVSAGGPRDGVCGAVGVRECRAARGECDRAEMCDGASTACPADSFAPTGVSCDDGLTCTGPGFCSSGACTRGTPLRCVASDRCHRALCSEGVGCVQSPIPDCVLDVGTDAALADRPQIDAAGDGPMTMDVPVTDAAGDRGDDAGRDVVEVADRDRSGEDAPAADVEPKDVGEPDTAGAMPASSGCGCSAQRGPRPHIAFGLLALAFLLRRRRFHDVGKTSSIRLNGAGHALQQPLPGSCGRRPRA